MSKANKFGHRTGGTVLAIRQHKDGSFHIGYPYRMFEINYSYYDFKNACSLFGLEYQTLFNFMNDAGMHPNEFLFMTL